MRVAVHAIKRGQQFPFAESFHVREHHLDGFLTCGAEFEAVQKLFGEVSDALRDVQTVHHLGKIPFKITRPANGIHTLFEAKAHQRLKSIHDADLRVLKDKWIKYHGCSLP